MASKNIKGITIEIGADTNKFSKALRGLNGEIVGLNNSLKTVNQALKLDPTNTDLLTQKQDLLKRNIEATKNKLTELKDAQKAAGDYNSLTDEQKQNYIKLTAEIEKSEKALKDLTEEYKKFGSVGKQQLQAVGDKMKEVGSKVTSFGKQFSGITAGILAIGTAATKSAGDLEQSMGGAEAVFGSFSDSVIENAKNSADVMGTSTNQYLEYANRIGSLMQGSGIETSKAVDLTTKAMNRASDVASIMGIDVSSAMDAIAGAAKGNFTMMDNLGVAMNATTLNAYALEQGLGKTYAQMTTGEKVELAYQMFLEKTSEYAGNYAKENDTLNGSLTTMQAKLANASAELGEKLLPIIIKVVDVITDLIDKFSNLSPEMQNTILIVGGILAVLPVLIMTIGGLITAVGTITAAIGAIIPIVGAVVAAITSPVGLIVAAVAAVVGVIILLWNKCEWFRDGVKAVLNWIKERITDAVNFVKGIPDKVKAIPGKIVDFFKNLPNKIKDVGKQMMEGIVNGVKEKWNNLKSSIENLGGKIIDKFKSVFGIHSPSRVMRDEIGENLGLGMIEGLEETRKEVNKAVGGLSSGIEASVNPTINPTANSNPLIIQIENFNNTRESDIQQLAQELEFYRRNSARARGGN